MTGLPAYEHIDTPAALERFCTALEGAPYVALDTEFLRERSYRPELCLVQLKHGEHLALIDALALEDLAPLTRLLDDPRTLKVVHAGSQDLEIFWLMNRRVPAPVFDTQLAAPLLGHAEQIGYANLVGAVLGVELEKSETRADWTRRPLTERQLAYALDDVIWLEKLYLALVAELESLGRLGWLAPELRALEDPARYEQDPAERWTRVKNVRRHKGATLAVIQALAEWREREARERNLPRGWLLKDDALVALAQQRPANAAELARVRGLERQARERDGAALLALIGEAAGREPKPLPTRARSAKLDAPRLARLALLEAWVRQRGDELGIAPGLLAPPKLLERMVRGEGRAALAGWREPLVGAELEALLEGRSALVADAGGIALVDAPRSA